MQPHILKVETFSLRVTAVLKNHGIKKGDIVGMLMNNCPEMPAIWLGNARLGAISPLINTNLRGNALIHSISVAKCDVLIFSDEYQSGRTYLVYVLPCRSCCGYSRNLNYNVVHCKKFTLIFLHWIV